MRRRLVMRAVFVMALMLTAQADALTGALDLTPPYPYGYSAVRIHPATPSAADFNITAADFANTSDPRPNTVYGWGYNGTGGSVENPAEHMLFWTLESYFQSGTSRYMEHNLVYANPSGFNTRLIQLYVDRGTNYSNIGFAFDRVDWRGHDSTALPWMTWLPSQLLLQGSTVVMHQANNVSFLQQLNGPGTAFAKLMYLDSANVFWLGQDPSLPGNQGGPRAQLKNPDDGETAMILLRNVGGVYTRQTVKLGPANSGGAGYRALIVPN